MDRGFLFGDGVYEVIPVYSRRPFRLREHLARLQASLDGIRLENPHASATWESLIGRIIEQAESEDQGIYVQVTRGPGPRDHAFPKQATPTVFILPLALTPPAPELVANGVAAITAPDNRWLRCDLKATSLLPNVLLRQLSVDAGCAETLLLRDGFLSEGSASNIFVVANGLLLAPPKSNLMLPGITYDVVLELARAQGIAHEVRPISETELRGAGEVWLTSSTKEVLAVTTLDDQPVGDGRPGPLFRRMHAAYQDYKHIVMRGVKSPPAPLLQSGE
ncbi:MAG: D-amino acid aminotransferase [Pseudomonadota bacterium]|nr:D-amino acid aminotransferase [Pseudomonadota bacterium]MDP1906277.1 D-amino acid aminotransferase [Pseudomonadota bacterium]MDP2351644.1 D-amino acid aminotransferase [Pseudomonadota bacterium]